MSEEEGTVTLGDVLALQDHLEESAVAVLGAADDKNCTYSQGYVKRQALYACLTCTPDICDPAGFCLACNYHCHEGHSIVELYTKRNFKCDCGNSKFGDKKCSLEPSKDPVNTLNEYNQNFKGKYCTCSRPYPDEENTDEMIQCALCEDWYHAGHLGVQTLPDDEEYSEMTCAACVNKHPVLILYPHLLVKEETEKDESKKESTLEVKSSITVDSEADESKAENETQGTATENQNLETNDTTANLKSENEAVVIPKPNVPEEAPKTNEIPKEVELQSPVVCDKNDKNTESDVDIETVKPKECVIKDKDLSVCTPVTGALFWEEGWRAQLCSCEKCLGYYKEHKIAFITDLSDMVEVYEKNSIASTQPPNPDADLAFLSTLDRVQQVEIISEYNDMKGKLVEYLRQFGEEKKVVKPEDIHKFFSNLTDCKRRRLNPDVGPPGFCR